MDIFIEAIKLIVGILIGTAIILEIMEWNRGKVEKKYRIFVLVMLILIEIVVMMG